VSHFVGGCTAHNRNVPVNDEGFEEIVVDLPSGRVVGIRVLTSRGDAGRGIVLVDKNGKPCGGDTSVTVNMADAAARSSVGAAASDPGPNRRSGASPAASPAAPAPISDEENQLLLQYGMMVVGALIALKVVLAAANVLALLLVPALYLYVAAHCPGNGSFDAKRELKRVMRGAHLPEEAQPKGFFEQGLNRIAASVTAELATSLGYEVRISDFAGAAKMAAVKVPVAGAEFYWIGVIGKWRYCGQRDIPGQND
ncbi:hypothetical protein ACHAWF_007609, partial [Thalassiosira exigua]